MQPAWRFEKTEFRDRSGITPYRLLHPTQQTGFVFFFPNLLQKVQFCKVQ